MERVREELGDTSGIPAGQDVSVNETNNVGLLLRGSLGHRAAEG